MAIGTVWEIVVKGHYGLQQTRNVFHFEETVDIETGGVTVKEFWNAWVSDLMLWLTGISTAQMVYDSWEAFEIGGVRYETDLIVDGTGTIAGDTLPPHDTYAFRYNRATTETRHGQKRFSGIPETWQAHGVANGSALISLNATAVFLGNVYDAVHGNPFDGRVKPVIMSEYVNGAPRPTPVFGDVSGVTYIRISTQNTRKLYR